MSKIQVDAIEQQTACGTTLTAGGGAGKTVVVDATTVTLGRCGGTVALASGATQSGFGRSGSVNWVTTPKTATTFTAVDGEGYFVDTTSNAITMTMPSGSAGAIVSIQDYNKTFDNNAFTVAPATGEKINGGTASGDLIINTEGQGLTFVYVDGTVGWKTVQENDFISGGSSFISATGGTESFSGNCKIHTFTGPGSFIVNGTAVCAVNNVVSHLVVGGGGGGGYCAGGAGGAGGYREVKSPITPYTASPLDGYACAPNRITVTAQTYPIDVGGGGTGQSSPGCVSNGGNSIFSTIISTGGGGGGNRPSPQCGAAGGSGGGNAADASQAPAGGAGNTPPVSPSQGFPGGSKLPANPPYNDGGLGGGGATAAGENMQNPFSPSVQAPDGGAGTTSSITASPVGYAGGGGGGGYTNCGPATGGTATQGGGNGATPSASGANGSDNTGGGGGGGGNGGSPTGSPGGNGGSGIIVIRYKYQ